MAPSLSTSLGSRFLSYIALYYSNIMYSSHAKYCSFNPNCPKVFSCSSTDSKAETFFIVQNKSDLRRNQKSPTIVKGGGSKEGKSWGNLIERTPAIVTEEFNLELSGIQGMIHYKANSLQLWACEVNLPYFQYSVVRLPGIRWIQTF